MALVSYFLMTHFMSSYKYSNTYSIVTYEIVAIGVVLFSIAFATTFPLSAHDVQTSSIIWLSAFAVFTTFIHGARCFDISDAHGTDRSALGISFYWMSKEFLWLAVFIISGAYPAIVGTALFILYPLWRKSGLRPR